MEETKMEDNRNEAMSQIEKQEATQTAQEAPQDAPEAAAGTDTTTAEDGQQAAPQDAHSMNYTHTFNPPVEILGKQYKSLTFYFENLTGEDVEAVELELQARNVIVLDASVSSAFQSGIAARAAGIAADEIARLPLRHYLKIKNAARDFLVAVGY